MNVLGVILARAGSKGLPDKCVRKLLGRPLIAYTVDHAIASKLLTRVVLSTDSEAAKAIGRAAGIEVIDRPAELATETATVDAAARHAVLEWESRFASHSPILSDVHHALRSPLDSDEEVLGCARDDRPGAQHEGRRQRASIGRHASARRCTSPPPDGGSTDRLAKATLPFLNKQFVDAVALLYGNIPVRRPGLIDEAIEKLIQTAADSVRSVAPVTKQHPDWVHRLEGDRMVQLRTNSIYRRQDLEPLYYHDGAIAVVTRASLFGALQTPDDHQSFLGRDRRAIVCEPENAVDVDGPIDLYFAEAVLKRNTETTNYGNAETTKHEEIPPQPRQAAARRPEKFDDCRSSDVEHRVRSGNEVRIGEHLIGPRGRVFIVAEAGVNHNGCVETARRMVDAAAGAGADAIKFQMFRAWELASAEAPLAAYQHERCGAMSQREMLEGLELTRADFVQIARRCEDVGIALVITPFGVEDFVGIEKLNVVPPRYPSDGRPIAGSEATVGRRPVRRVSRDHCSQNGGTPVAAVKIASTDLTNGPLLDLAAATGLPLILSTGASTEAEIMDAVGGLARQGALERLILLHCVSCYPTPVGNANLRAMGELRRRFGVPVGLSDHTTSVEMGGWAAAAGAGVLEKHFTFDRSSPGPDHAMSLTPPELTEYVRQVREVESALGSGALGMTPLQAGVAAAARKSVVAAVSIPTGARLTPSMLTLKRPGTGIPPKDLTALIGREAAADIPNDTLLSWEMLK